MKRHIVIAGKRHVGKTTLVNRILDDNSVPVYGFRTASGKSLRQGYRSFFMHPAGAPERFESEENHIGDGNGIKPVGYPEVFDSYGLKCLEAKPDGVIVMDELGFMEKDAELFCNKILELFDGHIPILATAKEGHDIELLNRIFEHPNAEVFHINTDNRDELYDTISALIRERGGLV